jgi:hypothetical protein
MSVLFLCIGGGVAFGDSEFMIENPALDFEVVDAYPFDGFGDFGPFDGGHVMLLGLHGESRTIVEFDISSFAVPAGEMIQSATFQFYVGAPDVAGHGVDTSFKPDTIAAYGYVGNGAMEQSDFEAGNDRFLERTTLGTPYLGQQLTFDVTAFVTDLVHAEETWVGLSTRAEQLGGIGWFEGPESPMLTIQTVPVPEPGTLALLGVVGLLAAPRSRRRR